jgi:hypothetical protein
MNITVPSSVAKKLDKVANKSAFIARAVVEEFRRREAEDFHKRLIEGYKYAAAHPEYEKDGRPDW